MGTAENFETLKTEIKMRFRAKDAEDAAEKPKCRTLNRSAGAL